MASITNPGKVLSLAYFPFHYLINGVKKKHILYTYKLKILLLR
jgi:hypothetical protein